MADVDKIKRNIGKMIDQGAPEDDINAYLSEEGVTTDQLRAHNPKADVGNIAAGLEGAAQGLSLGFADEIEGGARTLYSKVTGDARPWGDVYGEAVAKPRERVKAASETNPVAFYGGEIGSGFLVPGGLARVGIKGALANSAGRGLGARTLAGAKEGAAYGAAYGAGKAEGGAEATLTGAVEGAGQGAAFGAAMPGAIDLGANVLSHAWRPFASALNPKGHAADKLSEAVARDLSRVDNAPGNASQRFADRVTSMTDTNPSARVADAGGENVRGLIKAASNVPNQAREGARKIVDARQANQWSRIEGNLDEA
jgi:hypothetical protein